jgi:hypothetical protein
LSRGQGEEDDGKAPRQADEPQRGRGLRAPEHLHGHSDPEHLAAENGEKIPGRVELVAAVPKGSIRIPPMRYLRGIVFFVEDRHGGDAYVKKYRTR